MEKKLKVVFWFTSGIFLGLFFLLSFVYIFYEKSYKGKIYPGVKIAGQNFGGQTQNEALNFFNKKNSEFEDVKFSFSFENLAVTVLARDLHYGFNSELLAKQAVSLGRSNDFFSNLSLKFQAIFLGADLAPSYTFSGEALEKSLAPLAQKINIEPVDALFNFESGRVVAFRPSSEGQEIEMEKLKKELASKFPLVVFGGKEQTISIPLPVVAKKPKIQTSEINNFGIKELIGQGVSKFTGSIPNRIYNIQLASSRLNGLLIAPGEIFSFDQALGDISKFTGYKEAFIIQEGKTILGDGGGVCQVSTTFFRAALNSGLPIIERRSHSYRVGYYEQDSGPGLDATVYAPSVDLKIKNDSANYILIQAYVNPLESTLAFSFYGTGDNRRVTLGKPIITNQKPPPEAKYNDDPSLSKGTVKQIDFAAWGADVSFTRKVERDGQIIISEVYNSNYRPWQAVYLRGTRE